MDLTDILRIFYSNSEEYIFISSVHGTFSRIDHILGHKSNLSKFKKIEMVSSIFYHNAMRLDINYKKKAVRSTNTWRLNNTFLNNQQVTEEIKREIKKFLETSDNEKNDNSKPMGCSKSSSKKDVYSNTVLPLEIRKILNGQPNFTPKTTGKRRTKIWQNKRNHKDLSRNK